MPAKGVCCLMNIFDMTSSLHTAEDDAGEGQGIRPMTKLRLQISVLVFLLLQIHASAQNNYSLYIRSIDKDSAFLTGSLGIPVSFSNRFTCQEYVSKLPAYLQSKGYMTASLDSTSYDSSFAKLVLFVGDIYKWAQIDPNEVGPDILQAIGWRDKLFSDKPMDFAQVQQWQVRILNYLENNGHPFARVYLDSLQLNGEKILPTDAKDSAGVGHISAKLKIDKGPFYKIYSIRVYGNAKISNEYLQRYLNLKNALGTGETIGLNWQQLQVKSPRLNILYQHPYLFNSPIGLDFVFDMFRKDSTFLNVNLQLGAQYVLNIHQAGKLFIQRFQSIVNGVNTGYVLQNRKLPDEADVSSVNLGIDYEFNNTNYRLNPTSGNELRIITSVGTKKLKKNTQILELKDPGDPTFDFDRLYDTLKLKTYQFRARVSAARYFPLGKQNRSTFKTAFNGGFLQSGNIFRNELFQIGGYKLLRGFDEESQYLSQFAIGTIEYHYLVGQNSFFYVLADGGWGRNNIQNIDASYTFFGTGLGLA